jgi:hypothetical protein
MKLLKYLVLAWFLSVASPAIAADVGLGFRFGTLGIGADVDIGLTDSVILRVGYSGFTYDATIDDTDVSYDADIELSNPFALLDWHAFDGTFRFTGGVVGGNTSADVVGKPQANGTYEIDGRTFTASQVGTLRGELEFGNSIAPYIGIGWGRAAGGDGRFSFLFDLGAVYAGEPDVKLTASCGPAAPPGSAACTQLRAAVAQEEQDLADDATEFRWYPVLSLGFAVRF